MVFSIRFDGCFSLKHSPVIPFIIAAYLINLYGYIVASANMWGHAR